MGSKVGFHGREKRSIFTSPRRNRCPAGCLVAKAYLGLCQCVGTSKTHHICPIGQQESPQSANRKDDRWPMLAGLRNRLTSAGMVLLSGALSYRQVSASETPGKRQWWWGEGCECMWLSLPASGIGSPPVGDCMILPLKKTWMRWLKEIFPSWHFHHLYEMDEVRMISTLKIPYEHSLVPHLSQPHILTKMMCFLLKHFPPLLS